MAQNARQQRPVLQNIVQKRSAYARPKKSRTSERSNGNASAVGGTACPQRRRSELRKTVQKENETEEQRELRRERQRRWRAKLSPEKTQQYKMTALARIARQDPEWHDRELEKRRKRKDARRDQYNATDRLSAQPRSGARNAKKREAYAMNPEHFCEQERARRAANPEHVRAMARAAYVRRKLNQRAPG
jgi:hypothetical protein